MTDLTEAQRRVLERLAQDDILYFISGRHAHYFWHGGGRPHPATIHNLQTRLLVAADRDESGSVYRITPAGRAALEKEE